MGMNLKLIMQVQVAAHGLKKIVKHAYQLGMQDALRFWQRNFAKRHFEGPLSVGLYRMAKRTKRYQQRKATKWHHQRPLEWTGETKRKILESMPDVSVRGQTATMTFSGIPEYFTRRSMPSEHGGTTQQPDKVRELKFVLENEADQMGRQVARTIDGETERALKKKGKL